MTTYTTPLEQLGVSSTPAAATEAAAVTPQSAAGTAARATRHVRRTGLLGGAGSRRRSRNHDQLLRSVRVRKLVRQVGGPVEKQYTVISLDDVQTYGLRLRGARNRNGAGAAH